MEQGSFSANLEVGAREGLLSAVPFNLPWAKCNYPKQKRGLILPFFFLPGEKEVLLLCLQLRPPKEVPRTPRKYDLPMPSHPSWSPGRSCKGRPEIFWLLPSSLVGSSPHNLDHLTFFLQNPEFSVFCLMHQELVTGGSLQGDQRQRGRAPW